MTPPERPEVAAVTSTFSSEAIAVMESLPRHASWYELTGACERDKLATAVTGPMESAEYDRRILLVTLQSALDELVERRRAGAAALDNPWAQRLLRAESENHCGDAACQTRRTAAAISVLTGWKEHTDVAWAVEVFEVEIGIRDSALVGREPQNIPSRGAIEAEAFERGRVAALEATAPSTPEPAHREGETTPGWTRTPSPRYQAHPGSRSIVAEINASTPEPALDVEREPEIGAERIARGIRAIRSAARSGPEIDTRRLADAIEAHSGGVNDLEAHCNIDDGSHLAIARAALTSEPRAAAPQEGDEG